MKHITTDDIVESGFISKEKILEYVTEEDIFELVFGFKPEEFQYVTSPFRENDRNPGCWFQIDVHTQKMRFIDFANPKKIKGVNMNNIDCFDAVMIHFNLYNFYKTLEFIKEALIDGKGVKHNIEQKIYKTRSPVKRVKSKIKILVNPRDFILKDKKFWFDRYEITKSNLKEDKVFPISKFKLINTKTGDHVIRVNDIGYVYTEFKSKNKKIYMPLEKGSNRFITNCDENDIGGMHSKIKSGRLLIITKSYKDFRVLKNLGLNVRWLQNEGMYPNSSEFTELLESFQKVVILFDNDKTGIEAAIKLVEIINSKWKNKASYTHLPENLITYGISDPSDTIHRRGKNNLINFLKSKNILS